MDIVGLLWPWAETWIQLGTHKNCLQTPTVSFTHPG